MKTPDFIAPYASLLKWALIAFLCLAILRGGCVWQRNIEADKRATLQGKIDAKGAALVNAGKALRASGDALREQDRAAGEAIAEAERTASLAKEAESVALGKYKALAERVKEEDRRWDEAARRKPDCDKLLKADLKAVCGVEPK